MREIATPAMRRLLGTAGLLGLVTVGDGFVYLALMEHGHLQTAWFPLLFVGTNTVFLALAIPLGRVADKTNRATVFVLGHVALGAAYLAAAAGTGLGIVLLCLALLGVFYAATDGVLAALASQWSPPGAASTGIAAAQTVVAVARLAASTCFGVLWVVFGAVPTMTGAAVVLAAIVPLGLWLMAGAARRSDGGGQQTRPPAARRGSGVPGGGA
jgi:MFS family permease